jgi:prepilin peptidase CpaA
VPIPLLVMTAAFAAVAAYCDWRSGEIPNRLTIPMLILAPVYHWLVQGPNGALTSLLGILACGLPTYLFFRTGGMGGGDVKLFAGLGALAGPVMGAEILMFSVLLACLQALVLVIRRGQLRQVAVTSWQMAKNGFLPRSRQVPVDQAQLTALRLGPAILVGTLLALAGA